jgi:hypothetical protein
MLRKWPSCVLAGLIIVAASPQHPDDEDMEHDTVA